MAAANPSVQEAAKAERIRAASKLWNVVALAVQIIVAKKIDAAKRKAGRLPIYSAVGIQKKF